MTQYYIGVDIGSTTVKVALTDEDYNIIFSEYERHHSQVREKTAQLLSHALDAVGDSRVCLSISGSAGLGVAEAAQLPFVQEVFATKHACKRLLKDIDVVVELGGEDAKILFLTGGAEERMNGTCAGGTGAFIDQMASLMSLSIDELDSLSLKSERIYNIASRCGVFAKSDIQPLLNQGANKADIAASIYQAIVDQTITGLAQGRPIRGKIAFLGGPLTFQLGLRDRFVKTLINENSTAVFPENSQFFVAIGAAMLSDKTKPMLLSELLEKIRAAAGGKTTLHTLEPLFSDEKEYGEFVARHEKASVGRVDINSYSGNAYLGIDAGSTTTKMVLLSENLELLYEYYASNHGEPLAIVKPQLIKIRELCGDRIKIAASAVTGYGEQLIKSAFGIDIGIVETTAHFYAARHFCKDVSFILDIGGQDIKCFRLKNGAVDSIMLNEACSSGCGSFIESFAAAMGYSVADFAKEGIYGKHPVDLGSRCTVFMNSSVKQAQKDGATVSDISSGLSVSVVKNALYKVIRVNNVAELGEHIVVQGGTFFNDCVLRAFEREIGRDVLRPQIAGLMGAFGCALFAKERFEGESTTATTEQLSAFTHTAKLVTCGGCTNKCKLTVNTFTDGTKMISGNRCEKPLGIAEKEKLPNVYDFKLKKLLSYKSKSPTREKIGLPLGLNMYDTLPFWFTIFDKLGFDVVTSGTATRALYSAGQHTIPSDTVCYPAKLMHGHVEKLMDMGVDIIFYPCMPYNFDEKKGDNHYNCPVVAYYPELLGANVSRLAQTRYMMPYFAPHSRKGFEKEFAKFMKAEFGIDKKSVLEAVDAGYKEYAEHLEQIAKFGQKAIAEAREKGKKIIVLAGRPYHCDPEINHGIDKLINLLDMAVITEDSVSLYEEKPRVAVLNQWTYHSRLYAAAKYVTTQPDMQMCQLVSFGCGLDAITTDEVRSILESGGKFYTQIKIDEITNLGAAKIRLRSLIDAAF
ncbi:MAG: 2-hydroxyglutaryl-CoA dehydratase [Ruminococcaceae bacterium]|nr:2-hydroxyglutaryl-CoA dehydratase [Oscillospiraceae bacterium]